MHPETPVEHRSLATNKMHQDDYRRPAQRIPGPLLPTRAQWRVAAPWKQFPLCPLEQEDRQEQQYLDELVDWHSATNKDHAFVPPLPLPGLLSSYRSEAVWDAFLASVEVAAEGDGTLLSVDQVVAVRIRGQAHREQSRLQQVTEPLRSGPQLPHPCISGEYFIIYLYAGHQRPGDVHEVSQRLSKQYGFTVSVLPLDIVYHSRLCNLAEPMAQQFWGRAVSSGVLLGILSAPPCETYSAARWRSIIAQDGGPLPVRSAREPWGRAANGIKYQLQTLVSNQLTQAWLVIALLALQTSTPFVMEHPAPPHLCGAASIWFVDEVCRLMAVPGVAARVILQGLYGAISAKPTQLLSFNLPESDRTLVSWRLSGSRPEWVTLCGKLSSGQWATAQAKAYPPALNGALVEAFFMKAQHLRSCKEGPGEAEAPAGFQDAVAAIRAAMRVSGFQMGLDYAR